MLVSNSSYQPTLNDSTYILSVTGTQRYANKSFEELRLEDIRSGNYRGDNSVKLQQKFGTSLESYKETSHDQTMHISITAMHKYSNKSFEELRLEDLLSSNYHGKPFLNNTIIASSMNINRDIIMESVDNTPSFHLSTTNTSNTSTSVFNITNPFTSNLNTPTVPDTPRNIFTSNIPHVVDNVKSSPANKPITTTTTTTTTTTSNSESIGLNQVIEDLKSHLVCGICLEVFHKCVTLSPCMHNLCSYCYYQCKTKAKKYSSPQCPQCRKYIKEVGLNHSINSIVDALAKHNPEIKRDQKELDEMDNNCKLEQDTVIVVPPAQTTQNLLSQPFSLDRFVPPPQTLIPRETTSSSSILFGLPTQPSTPVQPNQPIGFHFPPHVQPSPPTNPFVNSQTTNTTIFITQPRSTSTSIFDSTPLFGTVNPFANNQQTSNTTIFMSQPRSANTNIFGSTNTNIFGSTNTNIFGSANTSVFGPH